MIKMLNLVKKNQMTKLEYCYKMVLVSLINSFKNFLIVATF